MKSIQKNSFFLSFCVLFFLDFGFLPHFSLNLNDTNLEGEKCTRLERWFIRKKYSLVRMYYIKVKNRDMNKNKKNKKKTELN